MESCLGKSGSNLREATLIRNDYRYLENEYGCDKAQKGFCNGHGDYLPSCNEVIDFGGAQNAINYSNFETTKGGSECDQSLRNQMVTRSLYNAEHQYQGPDDIASLYTQQYVFGENAKDIFNCPVLF